jgi:hypothetical protein
LSLRLRGFGARRTRPSGLPDDARNLGFRNRGARRGGLLASQFGEAVIQLDGFDADELLGFFLIGG